ncbi:MAG: Uma2 family endonuclease [Candidatus Bipolaricaulia bacterium]
MRIQAVDERKRQLNEPYLIRVGGWTRERYLREAPDNQMWEFVGGEVIMHSPATAEHQRVVGFLYRLLAEYLETQNGGMVLTGPTAVDLLPEVTREPDLFVVAPEDAERATGTPLAITPSLVIEVTSPSTRRMDLAEKAEEYARAGVPEYWAVDLPEAALVVHRRDRERYDTERLASDPVESDAVAGFWIHAEWLFQSPLPSGRDCLQSILNG